MHCRAPSTEHRARAARRLFGRAPSAERRASPLLACLLIALLLLVLERGWAPLERLELQTVDWRFAWRGARAPAPGIVLVTIDEKSLAEMAPEVAWPWPRSVHAELVRALHRGGAAGIVFDVLFADRGNREEDAEFAAAMRQAGNVFLAAFLPPEGIGGGGGSGAREAIEVTGDRVAASDAMRAKTPPVPRPLPAWLLPPTREFFWTLPLPELIAAARGVGLAALPADADSVYRRATPARAVDNGRLYPHLAVVAAAHRLGVAPQEIRVRPDAVALGERRVPIAADGTVAIDFAGPPPSPGQPGLFPRYSYSEVLRASPRFGRRGTVTEPIPADAFRDRIVFIGATAPGLYDLRPSPFSPINPAVETHANLTAGILEQRFIVEPAGWFFPVVLFGIAGAAGLGLSVARMRPALLYTLFAGVAYVALAHALFDARRVLLPMAAPLLCLGACYGGVTALRFQAEWQERRRYRDYLERYLTPEVADEVVRAGPLAMTGRRLEVTALFADIRGFTAMSEAMEPDQVTAMLDEYFARMVPVILARQGTLMQYVGDEIMAVWGAPLERPDHAVHAVLAGIEMLDALRDLQASWRERGLPVMEIGIGVHTGPVIAGNMGTPDRLQYSVVGDTVNTASRIQGLNKEFGTRMLISEATHARVAEFVHARALPRAPVRGKAEPIVVCEVLGRVSP